MAVEKTPNLGLFWGWEDGEDGWGQPFNYNLLILDVVTNALAQSATTKTPPEGAPDGVVYIVPDDAEGEWEQRRGMVAARITGDWHYFQPHKGWYFRIEDTRLSLMYDGETWARYDGDKGDKGDRGDSIQLRKTDTAIEWRYPGEQWLTLVPLSEIKGPIGDVTQQALSAMNTAVAAANSASSSANEAGTARDLTFLYQQSAANSAAAAAEDREAVAQDKETIHGWLDDAERYRDEAQEAAETATTKAGEASASAIAAEQAKNAAEEAAGDAEAAKEVAEQKAEEAAASADTAEKTVPVFSATPPANPIPGARWTDAETGRTYEWIVDEDGGQWVETGASIQVGYSIKEVSDNAIQAAADAAQSAEAAAISAAAAAISEANAADSAAAAQAYEQAARAAIESFAAGYTGFDDGHSYDFGSIADPMTYFNRDFGGLT